MTLTELKYIVAVAREKHFGKAAEACFVSQPTLSVAIKKLEEELELKIFERNASEIAVTPRGKNPDLARLKRDEGEKILKALPREARLVTLDERGGQWTTEQLALRLQRWQQDGRDVALAIGGPDGHAPEVLARAEESWGLSKLVLPHALVRVLVVEALYRAWSLNANHPYHRA